MIKILFVKLLSLSIIIPQTKKIDVKDVIQHKGVFYKNFSEEIVDGMIYQYINDITIPLGLIKNGFKEGEWLEWADKNISAEIQTDKIHLNKKTEIETNNSGSFIPSSLQIDNYISKTKYHKPVFSLAFTTVINFDSNGSKMEESWRTYNEDGMLERDTYRKYEYVGNSESNIKKVKIFNDTNLLIEQELFFYDSNKQIVEKKIFDSNDELIKKIVYNYDSLGTLYKKVDYNGYGDKKNSISIDYDKTGKKNKEKLEFFSKEVNSEFSIENFFTYDQKGKIIKMESIYYKTYFYYNDLLLLAEEVTYLTNSESPDDKNIILSKKIYNYY